jgi:hypothetical protein
MHISIKLNNAASNDSCAICGGGADHETGPEPFLDGTWEPVCLRCADERAPELVECLLDHRGVREGLFVRRARQRDPEKFAAAQEDWEEERRMMD